MVQKVASLYYLHNIGNESEGLRSVALNASGVAVEVHVGDQKKLLSQVWLPNGGVCDFGDLVECGSGRSATVALNDSNVAVMVSDDGAMSANLTYKVGIVNIATRKVEWGATLKLDDGKGAWAAVAIKNNVVVEVHESSGISSKLWYHVGVVDPGTKTVSWGKSLQVNKSGSKPCVVMTSSGCVVVSFAAGSLISNLYYIVGKLDSSAKTITWPKGGAHSYVRGAWPAMAITDDDWVTEVHLSDWNGACWGNYGTLDEVNGTITWLSGDRVYSPGSLGSAPPALCTNGREVIEVRGDGYIVTTLRNRAVWMQDNLALLGNRTLKQLVLPASHDSGMYMTQKCAGVGGVGANDCNAKTQDMRISEQLLAGARFLDLRAIREKGGTIYIGHFQGSLGCDGPDLATVLGDVKTFLEAHKELVILKFAHNHDRESGNDMNETQLTAVCSQIHDALESHLFITQDKLASIPLSTFIASKGIALIFIKGLSTTLKAKYPGFYSYSDDGSAADLTVFDQYSEKNDPQQMIDKQFGFMWDQANRSRDLFLLSWTLTLTTAQAIDCAARPSKATTIFNLADSANAELWPEIADAFASGDLYQKTIPNLIYVDKFHGDVTDVAVWLNQNLRTGNTLDGGQYLVPGARIYSASKTAYLTYLDNGDLVTRGAGDDERVWHSNTAGKPTWRAWMEAGGNLHVYSGPGKSEWDAGTDSHPNAKAVVQDDGTLVIQDSAGQTLKTFSKN